jgi:hypothetical protein
MLDFLKGIFSCAHARYSWPRASATGNYVACLDCGKELPYDWAGLGGTPVQGLTTRVTAPPRLILTEPGLYTIAAGPKGQRATNSHNGPCWELCLKKR